MEDRVTMVIPGEAEGHSGDPQIRRITLVILLKEEGGVGDRCRGGGLFWGSSWSRRVVLVIPADEESCCGDPHGAGELF